MILNIFLALGITLLIEPFLCSIVDKFSLKIFIVSTLANLVLNVTMNVTLSFIKDYTLYIIILGIFEALTIIIETLLIKLICKTKTGLTLGLVFVANLGSFLIGYGLNNTVLSNNNIGKIITLVISYALFACLFSLVFLNNHADKKDKSHH